MRKNRGSLFDAANIGLVLRMQELKNDQADILNNYKKYLQIQ